MRRRHQQINLQIPGDGERLPVTVSECPQCFYVGTGYRCDRGGGGWGGINWGFLPILCQNNLLHKNQTYTALVPWHRLDKIRTVEGLFLLIIYLSVFRWIGKWPDYSRESLSTVFITTLSNYLNNPKMLLMNFSNPPREVRGKHFPGNPFVWRVTTRTSLPITVSECPTCPKLWVL